MPIYLRQSTASQEIPLGYFVDSADGNTEETGLTIANTDIKIWKAGATTLANKNSGGGTHISNGIYYAVLDATDTDTIGSLVVFVHVAGALTVRVECVVLDEAVYDVQFGTVAPATATNITAGTITTVGTLTTYTGNTPQTGDSFARIGANGAGLTALGDARLANLDATVSSRLATAGYTAPPTAAVIADAVLDEDMTAHQTQGSLGQAIGDPVADANTIYKAVVTDAAGATVGVDVVAVKAETASIQSDTNDIQARIPAALVSGRMDSSIGAMAANVITAASMAADASAEIAATWLATVVEGAHTLGDFMRLFAGVLTGKSSGGGTTTVVFRDVGDTKNRVSATVDASGNRTAIGTRDGT